MSAERHSKPVSPLEQFNEVCHFFAQNEVHNFIKVITLHKDIFDGLVSGREEYKSALNDGQLFANDLKEILRKSFVKPLLYIEHLQNFSGDIKYFDKIKGQNFLLANPTLLTFIYSKKDEFEELIKPLAPVINSVIEATRDQEQARPSVDDASAMPIAKRQHMRERSRSFYLPGGNS